jgi:hypothetical protein
MAKSEYGRHWGAGSVVLLIIVFGFIGLFLVGFALYAGIPGWAKVHGAEAPKLGDLASAGQFFSLVFGIPLAFTTLCVGLASIWHFSSTRDEVEILRFYEEKIVTPYGRRLQRVMTQVQQIVAGANLARAVCSDIWDRFVTQHPDGNVGATDFASWFSESDKQAVVDAMTKAKFEETFAAWKQHYLELLTETFESALAIERMRQVLADKNGTPMIYLRRCLPEKIQNILGIANKEMTLACAPAGRLCSAPQTGRNPADDPYELFGLIQFLAANVEPMDLVYADVFQPPDGQTTVEWVGALLGQASFRLKAPLAVTSMNGASITGYTVNLGAAAFLTLFQYLPDRKSLCQSFANVYGTKSGLTRRFLAASGPEPAVFTSTAAYQSLAAQIGHWERLLLIHTTEGVECYDPDRHGTIPDTVI